MYLFLRLSFSLSHTHTLYLSLGENMKQLELSAEKAVEREEKLKDKILNIQQKYKAAEGRYGGLIISCPSISYTKGFVHYIMDI